MQNIYKGLCEFLSKAQIRIDEPMKQHTTFRIGGPAAFYVTPETPKQIARVLSLCQAEEVPYYVLGNGSNLLVSDAGFAGVVIAMEQGFRKISWRRDHVTAGAGALLGAVARQAVDRSLTGMEFAAGIPGTLGGAVVMNAGAYGTEMKDILIQVTVLTLDGQTLVLPAADLQLSYRTSCIPACQYIVLEAELSLRVGRVASIQSRMEGLAGQRRSKQPLEFPSGGSTFKRPEGYFAGKLIEDAGLKGYQIGGAQVSEKHSGFVINKEEAAAADVIALCDHIQAVVRDKFGVELEREIRLLGDFQRQ